MPIRILVVENHVLVRQGLIHLLSMDKDFEVVGEAGNGFEAIEKARALKPDIISMGMRMPVLDGIAATLQIKRETPNVRVVMVTASDEERDIREAVKAGVNGYLFTTSTSAEKFFADLKIVASGDAVISEELVQKLFEEMRSRRPSRTTEYVLTERQKDVLSLIARGKTNREIAQVLGISTQSGVQYHVRTLLHNLRLASRAELLDYAVKHGFAERKVNV